MCKLAGIPFKWFNWSIVAANGMLVDWMVNEYSNVFDDNFRTCLKDAQKDFGNILLI